MDGARFDSLTRRLAAASSRRTLVKGAIAGAVGLTARSASTAAQSACPADQVQNARGACLCKTSGRPPVDGLCPCPVGETRCDGGPCTDLESDPVNCGGCGNVCPGGDNATPACRRGRCALKCNPGYKRCDGACIPEDGCCTVDECPPPSDPCQAAATCIFNVCGYDPSPAGTLCRETAGPCDVEERCDGASSDCPADAFAESTVICRSAADVCDLPAMCTGSGPDCPPNPFKGASTICREATGPCDIAETCTASSAACPDDGVQPDGYECRPAADACDIAETCNGVAKTCPADQRQADDTSCGTGLICCGGVCVSNTATTSCGVCANDCAFGEVCDAGTCACPSLTSSESEICSANETCAITGFSPSSGLMAGCCPADGVLCEFGNNAPYDLCCLAGDTCVPQTLFGQTVSRCSSSGEFCLSLPSANTIICEPGETCAITEFAFPSTLSTGCCPADGVLCDFGTLGDVFGFDLCCPAGDTCETQDLGGPNFTRCSSQGEICFLTSGSTRTCEPGETCAITEIDLGSPSGFEIGCCPADGVLCAFDLGLPVPYPFDLCCPAGDTCESIDGGIPRCSSDG